MSRKDQISVTALDMGVDEKELYTLIRSVASDFASQKAYRDKYGSTIPSEVYERTRDDFDVWVEL